MDSMHYLVIASYLLMCWDHHLPYVYNALIKQSASKTCAPKDERKEVLVKEEHVMVIGINIIFFMTPAGAGVNGGGVSDCRVNGDGVTDGVSSDVRIHLDFVFE
ncbi:hypothetical protein LIER_25712 [Lithospermum erythrorhizon]|uniref:Uncharacterized protein n=1 Tax=Lithospermum erythrorhizon TaxID=34254 RepID=A0AAV3R5V4_LITER